MKYSQIPPIDDTTFFNRLDYYVDEQDRDSYRELKQCLEEERVIDDNGNWYPTDLLEIACEAFESNMKIHAGRYNPLPDKLALRAVRPHLTTFKEMESESRKRN